MGTDYATITGGLKKTSTSSSEIVKQALFLGGPSVTKDALAYVDPQRGGWGRLFIVRDALFVKKAIPEAYKFFKHILEYANTGIQGIGDYQLQTTNMTAGYAGRNITIPTVTTDGMENFTVAVYEMSGSPIRSVIDFWINGMSDKMSTFTHYNGVKLPKSLANQTIEAIYVATDNTGLEAEYACLLANCFPTVINTDVYTYTAGTHDLITHEIQFSCTRYESIQINQIASQLIKKYRILMNSMNFYSGYSSVNDNSDAMSEFSNTISGQPTGYNVTDGTLSRQSDKTDVGSYIPIPGVDVGAGVGAKTWTSWDSNSDVENV